MSTFDAREAAAKAEGDYPPFAFTGMDGVQHELPHPMTLTTGQAQQLNEAQRDGDESAMFALFDVLAPDAAAAVKAMPVHVTGQLFDAWYAVVDDSGKAPSPRSGPNRAARRSKPTSRSAA